MKVAKYNRLKLAIVAALLELSPESFMHAADTPTDVSEAELVKASSVTKTNGGNGYVTRASATPRWVTRTTVISWPQVLLGSPAMRLR